MLWSLIFGYVSGSAHILWLSLLEIGDFEISTFISGAVFAVIIFLINIPIFYFISGVWFIFNFKIKYLDDKWISQFVFAIVCSVINSIIIQSYLFDIFRINNLEFLNLFGIITGFSAILLPRVFITKLKPKNVKAYFGI